MKSNKRADEATPPPQPVVASEGDILLSREEAAQYLGFSSKTLAVWASTGRYGLPMVKIGRLVKYRKSALDEFINRYSV